MTPEPHEAGRGIRDQIERYRTAFIAVVVMVAAGVLIGGYVLSNERLALPEWVPFVGTSNFIIKAELQTAQAVTAGQGQAVTIAGAKIGEVESVDLHDGVAEVTMDIRPKYARYVYRDATLLLRPKTQLKDMTVQIDPGHPSAGRIHEGETFDLAQTAPDENLETLWDSLDKETRVYLQELLAGAGVALKHNGRALSAVFRRFDPTARDIERISHELHRYQINIARSIHNFQLLMTELGGKDRQVAELVQSADRVLGVFAAEDKTVQRTLQLLPSTLSKTDAGLAKLAESAEVVGPTLTKLQSFATALGPAMKASKSFFAETAPIIKNEVKPLTEEINPVLKKVAPTTKEFDEALPAFTTSFSVINELFNELAYNPGPKQAGFLFFLEWANHNVDSALSTGDVAGPMGRTVLYFNCELASLLKSVGTVNKNVNLLVELLKPPGKQECEEHGLNVAGSEASTASTRSGSGGGG